MIKPIKNISFCGNEQTVKLSKANAAYAQKAASASMPEIPQKKLSLKERFLNTIKGFNNVTGTAAGFARGIIDGVIVTSLVCFIGKNIKDAEGNIGKTIQGMIKDTGKAIKHVVTQSIPKIITKAPIDNIKSLKDAPGKFYKEYLGGNKKIGIIATAIGVAALALRTLQGKLNANKKNADLDHYTNTKH